MKDYPGINGKPFYLKFDTLWFKKGECITTGLGVNMVVVKVYKYNWWRKLLIKLGFKVKVGILKVKTI